MAYALDEVDPTTIAGGPGVTKFKDMMDRVDDNEKWFFQTADARSYILTCGDVDEADDKGVQDQEAQDGELVPRRSSLEGLLVDT